MYEIKYKKIKGNDNIDLIIVFGHSNENKISDVFKFRLDMAIKYARKFNIRNILITGKGKSSDPNFSEAEKGRKYIEKRQEGLNIFVEKKSTNTPENIINIKKWINPDCEYLLISSEAHIKRCVVLFLNFYNITPHIPAEFNINKNTDWEQQMIQTDLLKFK